MPGRLRTAPPTPAAATIAAVDYRSVSFWLGDSGDDLTPRPALDGSTEADVAILGAGTDRPVDRVLPAAPRPIAADRDPRARDRGLRRERPQRRLVRPGPEHLDEPARPPPRHGRRPGDAAGDVRRRRRGGPRDRRGGHRRRLPQGRGAARRARPARRPEPRGCARGVRALRLRRPLPPARRRRDRGHGPDRGRRPRAVHRQRGGHPPGPARARPRAARRVAWASSSTRARP